MTDAGGGSKPESRAAGGTESIGRAAGARVVAPPRASLRAETPGERERPAVPGAMADTVPESARDRRLSLIGVGRLGLCLALVAERAGYDVLGVDVLPQYVESINRRTLHSAEPHVNEYLRSAKRLRATTDMDEAIEFALRRHAAVAGVDAHQRAPAAPQGGHHLLHGAAGLYRQYRARAAGRLRWGGFAVQPGVYSAGQYRPRAGVPGHGAYRGGQWSRWRFGGADVARLCAQSGRGERAPHVGRVGRDRQTGAQLLHHHEDQFRQHHRRRGRPHPARRQARHPAEHRGGYARRRQVSAAGLRLRRAVLPPRQPCVWRLRRVGGHRAAIEPRHRCLQRAACAAYGRATVSTGSRPVCV
eukprot:ctg_224.g158